MLIFYIREIKMIDTLLAYEGFSAEIEYDYEDKIFVGHVLNINDSVGFHGKNEQELIESFHDAIANYKERQR